MTFSLNVPVAQGFQPHETNLRFRTPNPDDTPVHGCNIEPMKTSSSRKKFADTYGEIVSKASVVPRPARSTGETDLGFGGWAGGSPDGDYYAVPVQNRER
jgi:hypothetical protein